MKRGLKPFTILFVIILPVILALSLFRPAGTAYAQRPLCYVDAGTSGNNSGSSWTDAYTTVQNALAASQQAKLTASDVAADDYFGYAVTVLRGNNAPTDISLSNNSVAENSPAGTAVGNFSATDPDPGDTFTYVLTDTATYPDNSSFQIVGNELQTAVVLDFETKKNYTIRVRVTDAGGLWFEKVFTINVTNVNEAPTDISLNSDSVAESSPVGTAVGNFSATDQDAGDMFTYSLAAEPGSIDNASFQIVGNQLQTNAVFDYETKNSYSIRVRVTDAGGLTFEKVFTINVTNVNEAPTAITLDNNSVLEEQAAGAAVGNFSTTDPDIADTFTYVLTDMANYPDNSSFQIVGNELQTAVVLDFETKSSYTIRVRSTDSGGLWVEREFTITVTDGNDPPPDITLSKQVDNPAPLPGQTVTFTIVAASTDMTVTNA
ncbi:MAG: hypothetical protein D6743_15875, partial [Calditrichaeota bacterium]